MLCFCDYEPCSQLIWTAMKTYEIGAALCFHCNRDAEQRRELSDPYLLCSGCFLECQGQKTMP